MMLLRRRFFAGGRLLFGRRGGRLTRLVGLVVVLELARAPASVAVPPELVPAVVAVRSPVTRPRVPVLHHRVIAASRLARSRDAACRRAANRTEASLCEVIRSEVIPCEVTVAAASHRDGSRHPGSHRLGSR
jgi:hypothetical protein